MISLVDNRTHVQPFTKSAFSTEMPVLNVPAHEKYDGFASFKRTSGQALALTPYIMENPAGGCRSNS